MNLYIMRHGEASFAAERDSLRNLTATGESEAVSAGKWLATQHQHVDLALCSPYNRARQTLAKVAETLISKRVLISEKLIPAADPDTALSLIVAELLSLPANSNVLVVSHMPLVCHLVTQFTRSHSPLFVTAGVMKLSVDVTDLSATLVQQYQGE